MIRNDISATGVINDRGQLSMYMGELNAFFSKHKGERVIARFFVAPTASSEALKGYYYHYVVPAVRDGLVKTGDREKTEEKTEQYLRSISPVCIEEDVSIETGEYHQRIRSARELSNRQLLEHIDFIRQFAAENLCVVIDDPRTI